MLQCVLIPWDNVSGAPPVQHRPVGSRVWHQGLLQIYWRQDSKIINPLWPSNTTGIWNYKYIRYMWELLSYARHQMRRLFSKNKLQTWILSFIAQVLWNKNSLIFMAVLFLLITRLFKDDKIMILLLLARAQGI